MRFGSSTAAAVVVCVRPWGVWSEARPLSPVAGVRLWVGEMGRGEWSQKGGMGKEGQPTPVGRAGWVWRGRLHLASSSRQSGREATREDRVESNDDALRSIPGAPSCGTPIESSTAEWISRTLPSIGLTQFFDGGVAWTAGWSRCGPHRPTHDRPRIRAYVERGQPLAHL